ncbi:invasion associated locus B family protein [Phaeospirillum tilakii]|uniref:Invasion associated locus B family protein n=1 Tax=Phaeospirillum tilakii TaxID=741673 RepID=A0ABW5C5N6_9PROT
MTRLRPFPSARICSALLSLLAFGLAAPPALAKDEPAPAPVWGQHCGKDGDSAKEACVLQQFVTAQPQNTPLLVVQFGFNGPENRPRLILSAPLGVMLTAGITLAIDGHKAVTAPFQICNNGGCLSVLDMDVAALDQFRQGKVLTVRYFAAEQKPIDLPVRLDGLDGALAKLAP